MSETISYYSIQQCQNEYFPKIFTTLSDFHVIINNTGTHIFFMTSMSPTTEKLHYLNKLSDTTHIPSDMYIKHNIHIFICRVLVVPETELSKQSSQECISSPEKIQTFCLTQQMHPVIQMIKVLQLYNLERLEDSKDGQHLRNSNSLT